MNTECLIRYSWTGVPASAGPGVPSSRVHRMHPTAVPAGLPSATAWMGVPVSTGSGVPGRRTVHRMHPTTAVPAGLPSATAWMGVPVSTGSGVPGSRRTVHRMHPTTAVPAGVPVSTGSGVPGSRRTAYHRLQPGWASRFQPDQACPAAERCIECTLLLLSRQAYHRLLDRSPDFSRIRRARPQNGA
jgi:hypothetical protein